MHGIDVQLFRWINSWPEDLSAVFWFLSEGSKDTRVRLAMALFALFLLVSSPQRRKAIIQVLLAFPLANGMTDVLKNGLKWTRPCVELMDISIRVEPLTSFGTASAHSANMAAVAFVMTYYFRWWGLPWVLVALLTGLSRVYVGVHYPSQVLFGWVCGVVAGLVVVKGWEYLVSLKTGRSHDPGKPIQPDQPEEPST
jgi:undecaprenyl-diphosphatase